MKPSVDGMSTWRTVVVTTLLLSAIMVHFYPNSIDDWAEKSTPPPSQEDYPYTSIQTSEKWLVLPVSFPNNPISPSNVADMFAGAGCSMCSAEDYINVMTDGQTELEIEIQEVWNAPNGVRQWGEDVGGERDYGSDGKGVESLLSSVVSEVLSGENLAPWDLNNDGVLDRVLLIHSAPPQESSGNSNSLWSHFSLLDDPLTVGEWEIEHYVVASTDSGLGTVIHEILHSMGALDLYDVHDELPTSNWNGIGDWGIMASGNWNGDGETPSMPSASSMNLIGLSRFIDIDTSKEGSYELYPITNGGNSLRIEIAPNEWIWFTLRGDVNFDSALPGHGILVEHQNRNNGDEANNLVNTDPSKSWVKIIEADGDAALQRGKDAGSSTDTFVEGEIIGAEGMVIRDSHGRLVTWTVSIDNLTSNKAIINITPISESPSIDVLPSFGPLEVLSGESIYASVHSLHACNLEIDIHSSSSFAEDGARLVSIQSGESTIELLPSIQLTNSAGYLKGTVGCIGEGSWDIDLDWYSVGHRLSTDALEAVIPWDKPSEITLRPNCQGEGPRTYSIALDGAISRIATVQTQGELLACPAVILEVEPDNLLTPGMLARGELVFVDTFGLEQRIPVEFTAQSSFNGDSPLAWLSQPSNGIMIILILLALSLTTGGKKPIKKEDDNPTEIPRDELI